MNDQDWGLLEAIYNEQNLTKAAERLFMSQPALTYRIQQIEQEFKIKVFSRTGKRIHFTPEGEHLVLYAKKMVLELQKTKDYMTNMNDQAEGELRIGVSSNFALYKLPTILKTFRDTYDKIQINVHTGWSSDIYQLIQNADVQVGIIRGDYTWFEQKYLINEERLCIISNIPIDIRQLPLLPRIHYQAEPKAHNLKHKTDPFLSKTIDNWWQETFNEPPNITMEVDHIETCKEMVKKGLGYAIIPRICLTEKEDLYTEDLIMADGQYLQRKTWMIYRDSTMDLSVVNKFVNFIKSLSF